MIFCNRSRFRYRLSPTLPDPLQILQKPLLSGCTGFLLLIPDTRHLLLHPVRRQVPPAYGILPANYEKSFPSAILPVPSIVPHHSHAKARSASAGYSEEMLHFHQQNPDKYGPVPPGFLPDHPLPNDKTIPAGSRYLPLPDTRSGHVRLKDGTASKVFHITGDLPLAEFFITDCWLLS